MSAEVEEFTVVTEDTPAEESPAVDELDRLDPIPDVVKLTNGMEVRILPLKARQFFKLLRIITRGAANVLPTLNLSVRQSEEEFMTNFTSLLVFAIPEAEYETVEFLRSMVEPNVPPNFDAKAREGLNRALDEELNNPELEDLVELLGAIVRREASDLRALGKRLQKMFALAQKTGQAPKESPAS